MRYFALPVITTALWPTKASSLPAPWLSTAPEGSGRRPILVTGRQLDELLRVFPGIRHFRTHRCRQRRGPLHSRERETEALAEPPPANLLDALRPRGVPSVPGKSSSATVEPYDAVVLEVIKELGLELQVIYNKGSVMVLPSGVNKSTGLAAALAELGLSPHNTVAVGDARTITPS